MSMDHLVKGFSIGKSTAFLKSLLFLTALVAVFGTFGCVKKIESYAPRPVKPKADGLASVGKFRAVVIEDMDNDGILDVVGGASSPGLVTINYGDGHGSISEPQYLPIKGDVRSVAVADFNEDGLPDIVFSVQRESSGIKVWLNQSNRQWRRVKGPIEINRYEAVRSGDVNGDGHMDIIAANATAATQGGIQVWLGNGKVKWPVESGPTISGVYMDVLPADVNNDGNLDLIGAGWGAYGALRIWLGDGSGNWSSIAPLEKGNFYGLSIGDLNGDGNFDIFAGSYRDGVRIFLGDGQGAFSRILSPEEHLRRKGKAQPKQTEDVVQSSSPKENRSYWTVLSLDLDEDGLMDILASSLDSEGIRTWRNKGNGGWAPFKGLFPSTGTYYEMTAADLDADKRMDICAASFGEGIKIWPGKDGAFKIVQQRKIEQVTSANRLAAEEAPIENNVYKTIDGVAEYKIDPGDTLEITLWEGTTPKKEEILVREDGKLSFGFVEDLSVKGLTSSQLDHLLTTYIAEYVKNPRIDVVVKDYNSKFVRVVGAIVYHGPGTGPGHYRLRGKASVLDMITRAGGPAKDANLQDVRIRRKNGQSVSLDLFKTINQGDPSQDLVVDDGDLVFVPALAEEGNRIYVFGEVENPGAYTFAGSDMHLFDAISKAGGSTVFASAERTRIVRGDPTSPEIMIADLKGLIEDGDLSQNVVLASGDLVYVPRSGFGDVNLYNKRIRPLFEIILWPARSVIDWNTAADLIKY